MSNTQGRFSGGIGFVELLAIVFIILKLTGLISWSWWWVTSPLWISAFLIILVLMILIAFSAINKA